MWLIVGQILWCLNLKNVCSYIFWDGILFTEKGTETIIKLLITSHCQLSRKNFKEKVHSKCQELPSKGFQCYPPKLPMVLLKMAPSVSQFQEEIVPAFLQTGQSKFLILCQAVHTAHKHISINMERTSKWIKLL